MNINKAFIGGRLGKDPEIKHTKNGKAVCHFSVATTNKWDGGEKTEWHNIIAWGKLGETCGQYLSKGAEVFVEGRIETREWTDKDGKKCYKTEIIAANVQFGTRAKKEEQPEEPRESQINDNDIPW